MSNGSTYPRRMQFRVLGPLEVDAGDGPVPLGGPKQRAVLATLLIHPNQVVSADALIDEVWGDEPPEKARHTLQTYVSNLRRALGEDRVLGRTPGYMLVLDPSDLDAARFDALVRDAKNALPVDPGVAVATFSDALDLWRGPAFADLTDRTSLRAEAARLDELRLEAQENRIDGLLEAGAQARAIGELETLIAGHPLRESLWRRLMLALYRDGRQADALGAYQRARELLADELGIDPSPELARLHERILKQDPDLDLRGRALRGYRLLERIDDGPNGSVFRAIQPHVGRDVAIKVFHEHIATDPIFIKRFEPDAQAIAALEHPHLVPVYDSWREPGRAYVVARYLRGGSLQGRLDRGERLDRASALRVIEQVATALAFVHRQEMAHGNLRPSNVLLDAEGNAYVGDLRIGGARQSRDEDVRALARLIAVVLPKDLPDRLVDLLHRTEVDADMPRAEEFAVAARGTHQPGEGERADRLDVRNPYKGLRPFTEAETRDFFGRTELIDRLVAGLNESGPGRRFLAVVGPSGSGKSSVVRAGLVPAIRRGALTDARDPAVAEMFPGTHPTEELASALTRIAVRPTHRLYDVLERGSRGLLDALDVVAPDGSEVVLVIDQLEELFTLTKDEREREGFLETIRVAIADPSSRIRVIVTLRADLYDQPLSYPRFGDVLASRTEAVPPLSPDELEQAIRAPAEREGVRPEPALVAEVIADVAHRRGALPLLQYALTELFERREDGRLTLDAYRSIGGIAGALSDRAERTFAATDAQGRGSIRQVFLRLVTVGADDRSMRRRVRVSDLHALDADPEAIDDVLDTFGRHRLLTFDREPVTREPIVEIAHEALIDAWERLRGWVDDAREDLRHERRLAHAAAEWRGAGEDPSFLLRGSRLEQLESWVGTTDLAVGRRERAYLNASVDQREDERDQERDRRERVAHVEARSRTRLRALVAVFAVAALVAGTLTLVATDQADRAADEARIATARGLAAAAVANLEDDAERSVLLAIEAVNHTRLVDGTVLPEAEEALHRAVTASRAVLTVPGVGGAVAWSERGVFVTEGPKGAGTIDIRDADTGTSAMPPFEGHRGDITDVAFSADGSVLATTGHDGALRVWNPGTGALLLEESHGGVARSPSFSDDGTLVSAVWNLNTVRVVDLDTGRMIQTFRTVNPPGQDRTFDAALRSDGRRIALVDDAGGVVIADVITGDEVVTLRGSTYVHALAWSPDDRSIATVGASGVIEIWDAETGDVEHELWGQKSFVWSVAWSPDGSRIVTGGDEGAVQVWSIGRADGREVLSLSSLEMAGGIAGVAFSPDGNRVLAGAIDRSWVKVWDVGPTGDAEWANLRGPLTWGDVAFLDGDQIAVTSGETSLDLWGLDPVGRLRSLGIPDRGTKARVEASADGRSMIIVGEHGSVTAFDTAAAELLFTTRQLGSPPSAWSPDGAFVAMGAGASVSIRDRSGREVTVLPPRDGDRRVAVVTFSPDGALLATSVRMRGGAPGEGLLRVWDWRRGLVAAESDARPARAIAFDGTGTRVVVSDGHVVESLDIRTGAHIEEQLSGQEGSTTGVALSPNGSRVATAGTDGTIRLFDATTGEHLLSLRGNEALVTALSFSPDGTKLASVRPAIARAGSPLVAEGSVRIWALDIDDLLEIARHNVTRSLTYEECRRFLDPSTCTAPPA